MPISVQTIVDRCNFQLDSEGSDRYIFDRDFSPAINSAKDWMVSLFNAYFAKNKLSEESLREISKIRVFLTSEYSRFNFDIPNEKLWTILAVYIKITAIGSQTAQPDSKISVYQPNRKFISSKFSADRLTLEQWNEKDENPFMPGSSLITDTGMIKYGYLGPVDYNSISQEIAISPEISQEEIALVYLQVPKSITLITDELQFPEALTDMIINKTLQYISIKQGEDSKNLYTITQNELNILTNLMK